MYLSLYPADPPPEISCTFRGEDAQNNEKAEGSSGVGWPYSTHNFFVRESPNPQLGVPEDVPKSLALDFYFNEGGKTSYRQDWMMRVIWLAQLAGLFSGMNWALKDYPHLALTEKVPVEVADGRKTAWLERVLMDLPPLPALPQQQSKPTYALYEQDVDGVTEVHRGTGEIVLRISQDLDSSNHVKVYLKREVEK